MTNRLLIALGCAAVLPVAASAQSWRTLDVSRQLHDTTELHVNVEYGAGRFDLRAASDPVLYSMQLRYDESNASPLHAYDASAGTLQIGLKDGSTGWMHRDSNDDSKASMQLALSPSVPLDLSLALGATQARVDLGGLTLRALNIASGAADATVDFSAPNRTRMASVTMDIGAASLTADHLANANASTLTVDGGVGSVNLGFGGAWTGDLDARVHVTLGKVTLRIPRDVGVQLDMQRFITSFDNDGLVKRDGYYYSDNWDTAKYHLRIHVQTALGGIAIDRFGGSAQP